MIVDIGFFEPYNRKTMTNVDPEKKSQSQIPPEDYSLKPDYWVNRPLHDEEKDWKGEQKDWVDGYVKSIDHPHRALIVNALKKLTPFESVVEAGANCGPNLFLIRKKFPNTRVAGIDLSAEAVEVGKKFVPEADLRVGSMIKLPWEDKSFDIALADASLMYISPDDIDTVMAELARVSKKAILIIERFDESEKGIIKNHIWTRNYPLILEKLGYKVEQVKIDENTWPGSVNWQKYGYLFIGTK